MVRVKSQQRPIRQVPIRRVRSRVPIKPLPKNAGDYLDEMGDIAFSLV